MDLNYQSTTLASGSRPGIQIAVAMQPRLIAKFFDEQLSEQLNSLGTVVTIDSWADLHVGDAPAKLIGADVLVTGWGTSRIDKAVLDLAPKLRAIVHSAGSVKHLIDASAFDRGIHVTSQAESNALPVAEFAVAMILLAGKGVFTVGHQYRASRIYEDPYDQSADIGNYGRRVGIVGASKIGRRLIELLAPYDIEVTIHDPYLSDEEAAVLGVRRTSLRELMASSDVVSLHAPLNESTTGMIGRDELALLRDGATLINTARGELLNEDALIAELQSVRINAVLDVLGPLTANAEGPLWELPNVVLTPHMAGSMGNELHRLGSGVLEDIRDLVRTGRIRKAIRAEEFALLA